MGSPYTVPDLLRATGTAIGRAAQYAGRGAKNAAGFVAENATVDDPLALSSVAAKFRTGQSEGSPATADATVVPDVPVNVAAIRASNARARPSIDMAKEIDFGATMAPRSQGTYVPPSQVAENRAVAARGAFQAAPEWRGAGGGLRSAAQMEQDLRAHALLDAGNEQALAGIRREEEVRGDPLSLATAARRRLIEYEDSLPADADSYIRSAVGRGPLRDYRGQRESVIGTPTLGEERLNRSLIAQAAAKQNPKDQAEAATTMGRGRIAEELSILQGQLQDEVRSGKRSPEDAQAKWNDALQKAQSLTEILKSGFPKGDPLLGQ